MQLCRDQFFRKRLAGIDVVRVLDVKGELHRRGVSGGNNYVVGGNEINKSASFRSAWFLRLNSLRLGFLYANQRTAQ